MCLTVDTYLIADPGVSSLILALSHTFMEIDRETISMPILLSSDSRRVFCQLQAKECALVNCLVKLAKKKVWLGELTIPT